MHSVITMKAKLNLDVDVDIAFVEFSLWILNSSKSLSYNTSTALQQNGMIFAEWINMNENCMKNASESPKKISDFVNNEFAVGKRTMSVNEA